MLSKKKLYRDPKEIFRRANLLNGRDRRPPEEMKCQDFRKRKINSKSETLKEGKKHRNLSTEKK